MNTAIFVFICTLSVIAAIAVGVLILAALAFLYGKIDELMEKM